MNDRIITLEEFKESSIDLSYEALNIRGSFDKIRKVLPEYFTSFKSLVSSFTFGEENTLSLFNENKYRLLSKDTNYTELRRKNVVVPKGLNVSYLDHLATLHKVQDTIDTLITDTLIPFEKYLAVLLSDPDTLKTQRESKIIKQIATHDIEELQKLIKKDFSKDQAERRTYGDVIGRQSDWYSIVSKHNDLVERLAKVPRTQVLELVEIITDHLETLLLRMEEDPETYVTSGVTVSDIAKLSYTLAKEVEFYAMFTFMVEGLQNSIENAADILTGKS